MYFIISFLDSPETAENEIRFFFPEFNSKEWTELHLEKVTSKQYSFVEDIFAHKFL